MAKVRIFLTELSGNRNFRARDGRGFPTVQFSGSMTENKERFLSLRIIKFFKAAIRLLSHAPSRSYGATALSFGIVTLLLYLTGLSADPSLATVVIGGVFVLLVPFLVMLFLVMLALNGVDHVDQRQRLAFLVGGVL